MMNHAQKPAPKAAPPGIESVRFGHEGDECIVHDVFRRRGANQTHRQAISRGGVAVVELTQGSAISGPGALDQRSIDQVPRLLLLQRSGILFTLLLWFQNRTSSGFTILDSIEDRHQLWVTGDRVSRR